MKLKSIFITCLMATALTLTSCANNQKKPSQAGVDTNASATVDDGKNSGVSLELNGDSDSGKAGDLKTVYFDFNSSALSEETKETLNKDAEYLKANKSIKVQIEGHCDERGSVQYNLALGEKRAKSTRDYLAGLGVESNRMSVISLGKEKPVAFGHDEESWSKNRRATFVITAK